MIAILDYCLHLNSEKNDVQSQKAVIKGESKRDKPIFQFIFSISLFFFLATLIILTKLSFMAEKNKFNGVYDDSNVTLLMILMCALGFFLGGPLRSYYSYRSIKAMGNL